MAGLWQRTGNVTVTNGSKTITGFGTKWKTGTLPIQKGHTFYGPDNAAYEVDTVVSDESILLVDTYRGGTLANQAYRIDITRTSTISQFAADLASLVAKYRSWFDGMMTWLTGSGDVAILNPDTGANVTIPSWKKVASEGEGQTARAKVEADRAKTEADRALTEADRAAGIVAAAALPLPDVWAPLSDSLRLITGYGRDVLVGSDVVARMVNFSRSSTATYIGKDGLLKTAAANEPRFEKDGLLVEGQSTNIITNSNVFTPYGTGATKVDNQPGPFGANDATRIDTVNVYTGTNQTPPSSLVDGAVYTTSVWLRGAVGGEAVRIGIHNSTVGLGVTLTTEWKRYSITQTRFAGTNSAFVIQAVNATTSFFVYGAQLEALPFASSYIPTNGAAVTRAKDI
ncbi:phage head spike fiber domain-containing protein, partial [Aeromonas caviae]|uniref:phage head spike fiber domain-containing protein n=1 Tax=Aeromonas caviae TaxID=648 RepID=UPI002B46C924